MSGPCGPFGSILIGCGRGGGGAVGAEELLEGLSGKQQIGFGSRCSADNQRHPSTCQTLVDGAEVVDPTRQLARRNERQLPKKY